MGKLVEIDVRYLGENDLPRFLKIREIVETSYEQAVSHLTINIPYVPRLYIIPFLKQIVSEGKKKLTWNTLRRDPWEAGKYAIITSLPFLVRANWKHIVTSFAHELAHLLDLARAPDIEKKMKGKTMRKIDLEMEKRVQDMFRYFKEPLRSWLVNWNATSNDPDFIEIIKSNAAFQIITSYRQFGRYLKSKPMAHVLENQNENSKD